MFRALALFRILLYASINIVDLAFIAAAFSLSLVLNIHLISEVSQGVNLSDTLRSLSGACFSIMRAISFVHLIATSFIF